MLAPAAAASNVGAGYRPWVQRLRACGLKATPQRVVVLGVLEDQGHATVEEVHTAAAERLAGLNVTTVYRTLSTLAEQDIVSHTHLVGGLKAYQLADEEAHAHLVCRSCDGVIELGHDLAAQIASAVSNAHGFELDPGHLSVFGTCHACAEADGEPRGTRYRSTQRATL